MIHYYQLTYLKAFKLDASKYAKLILLIFFQHQDEHDKQHLKNNKIQLKILSDTDMSFTVKQISEAEYTMLSI